MTRHLSHERLHRQRVDEVSAIGKVIRLGDRGVCVLERQLEVADVGERLGDATSRSRPERCVVGVEDALESLERRCAADGLVEHRPERTESLVPGLASAAGCGRVLEQRAGPVGVPRLEVRLGRGDQAAGATVRIAWWRETRGLLEEERAGSTGTAPTCRLGSTREVRGDCLVRPCAGEREVARTRLGRLGELGEAEMRSTAPALGRVAVDRRGEQRMRELHDPVDKYQHSVLDRLGERSLHVRLDHAREQLHTGVSRRRGGEEQGTRLGRQLAEPRAQRVGERRRESEGEAVRVRPGDDARQLEGVERVAAARRVDVHQLRPGECRAESFANDAVQRAGTQRARLQRRAGQAERRSAELEARPGIQPPGQQHRDVVAGAEVAERIRQCDAR